MKQYCTKELETLRAIVKDVVRSLRVAHKRVPCDTIRKAVNDALPEHSRIKACRLFIRTRRGLVTKPGQAYQRGSLA